jgi:hypothetical protein
MAAFAATAAPPTANDPAAAGSAPAQGSPRSSPARSDADRSMTGKAEQRISSLHARLQITPAQQPQWDQFAQVMRDNARLMDETFQRRTQNFATMTAEESMASYAQVAMAHAQGMQNLVPSFHALYGTMSDLQKRAADQVFREDGHRGDKRGRPQGTRG